MAVDVGSAVGHLDLDISGFLANLKSAQSEADSASKSIASKIGTNFTSVGKTLTSVGTTLTKNVTVPIVGIGTAAVKVTSDFDSAMSKVSAISGATGKDFDNLRAKAIEMGAKTKFSATESAEAFTYMAMAGWDTEAMLEGIDGIMALSAADGLDLATTSDIVTDALTAFGMEAKDSVHFADVLAKASSSANTNVSLLGESFKYAAPVAGALGYTAEDVAVALGLMANAGIKGSQGGTALRSSLSRLIKPTDDAAAMMERYELSLTNADGTIKPLGDVMNMLRDRLGGLSEAEQAQAAATLFGQEAMSGMLAIINTSDADYKKLTESVYSADGAAQQMADTMLNNLSGQLTLLKSALEGLAIQIGDIIMPYIMKFVEKLQELVQWFQNLDETQKENIVRFAVIAATIGPVIIVIGKLFTAVGSIASGFSKLGTLMTSLKSGFSALGAAIGGISAPVAAIIAIIAVLIAAFVDLWKNNEDFRNKIMAIWDEIKAKFEAFGQGIVDRLNALGFDFESFTDVLKALWKGLCDFLAPIFEGAFQLISDILGTVFDVLTGLFDVFAGLFTGNWEQMWTGVKEIFGGIWDGIKNIFSTVLDMLKNVADVFLGWFGTDWDTVWTSIKDFFVNIWNSITTFFTNIIEGIKNTAITVWNTIKTNITTVINAISSIISSVWNTIKTNIANVINSISSTISSVWNSIKSTITKVINSISSSISSVFNSIKTTITNVFNSIKSTATTVWNGIKSAIQTPIGAAKTAVSNAVNSVKSTVSSVFNSVKSTVTSVWNNIKSAITTPINSARDAVKSAINKMKGFFNFSWSLPKIKLPHFSISGSFSLNPPSIPRFSISWYKKAMDKGMIMNGPTIFGFDSKTGKFLGGGEAGSETVVGTENLFQMIRSAVSSVMLVFVDKMTQHIDAIISTYSSANDRLYSVMERLIVLSQQFAYAVENLGYVAYEGFSQGREAIERVRNNPNPNNNGGGDTFIFNSPKPIDEIEAAKQMKQTKRDLAEGF